MHIFSSIRFESSVTSTVLQEGAVRRCVWEVKRTTRAECSCRTKVQRQCDPTDKSSEVSRVRVEDQSRASRLSLDQIREAAVRRLGGWGPTPAICSPPEAPEIHAHRRPAWQLPQRPQPCKVADLLPNLRPQFTPLKPKAWESQKSATPFGLVLQAC